MFSSCKRAKVNKANFDVRWSGAVIKVLGRKPEQF